MDDFGPLVSREEISAMQKLQPGHFVVPCDSIAGGCGFRARGETAEEATQRLMAHAKAEHGMSLTADVITRARSAVREEAD
jgi:predicted small metal-binding protein